MSTLYQSPDCLQSTGVVQCVSYDTSVKESLLQYPPEEGNHVHDVAQLQPLPHLLQGRAFQAMTLCHYHPLITVIT